jgi:KDO2-lipid IV(A) lauroyltransferase
MMVAAGAMSGMPLTMVTKHLKPEWLHKKVEASRLSVGVKGAYEPRTLPVVMRALRDGASVGFVMDQYAGPPIGIPVPFFGVKVGTLAAVGTLANRTGAAVVPVKTYRDEKGVVHVCVEPMIEMPQDSDDEATTARLAAKVEQWVREYPAQWLWVHRRFKNVVWPE